MSHSVSLMLRLARGSAALNQCISFRFEKERYTPYTELHGKWYCPPNTNITEVLGIMFYIDGVMRHYGYPASVGFEKKDGRLIINISSIGYTSALTSNQCPDGLHTDIDLARLVKAGVSVPFVSYQQNTPEVNYVNYYDGTTMWDAIVCYSLRASDCYPYINGYNTVRISPHDGREGISLTSDELISRSNSCDYARMISKINEKDVDGTPEAFTITNGGATSRSIVRSREINFDREWIMDPDGGLRYKIYYSMRKLYCDIFSYHGCSSLDLLDGFKVTDIGFSGEVDRLIITGSAETGFVTTVWCYNDGYCPVKT